MWVGIAHEEFHTINEQKSQISCMEVFINIYFVQFSSICFYNKQQNVIEFNLLHVKKNNIYS